MKNMARDAKGRPIAIPRFVRIQKVLSVVLDAIVMRQLRRRRVGIEPGEAAPVV
jgi:hypothetical protein